jgi:hypothetical protein
MVAGAVGAVAICLASSPAWADLSPTPGSTWGANDTVTAMVTVGGETVIGGAFTAVTDLSGVSHPASHIAVVDNATGAVNTSWLGSADGDVNALAVAGTTLYLGGKFDKVDGVTHRKLAAINLTTGSILTGFTGTAKGNVMALAATPTAVFAGGSFTSVASSGGTVSRSYVAKFDGVTGAVDTGWSVTPNDKVLSLVVSDDDSTLYLGGNFTHINTSLGSAYSDAVTTADPATLTAYRPHLGGPVLGGSYNGGSLYLAVGGNGGACAAVSGSTGSQLWYRQADGNANAIVVIDGTAYCGGHFATLSGGLIRHHLVAISTTSPYATSSYAPVVNSALGIDALSTDGTNLYLGGYFTKVGTKARAHYAELPAIA